MKYTTRILLTAALAAAGGYGQFSTGIPGLGGRTPGGRQQPGGQGQGQGQGRGGGQRPVSAADREKNQFEEFAKDLGLSSSQKKKAKTILDDARVSAESVQDEIRIAREEVVRAVKDGKSEGEVDKLTDAQGKVYGRLAAVEATAFRRIFAVLDDTQKSRAEDVLARSIGRFLVREPGQQRGFGGSRAAE